MVLADADPELAARGIVWGKLANGGRNCVSVQRVLVEANEGTLATVPAGPHAVLVTLVNKQAKLGVVMELMVRWARQVAELMG